MSLQERFDAALGGLLPDGRTVLLGVSGGADSICMAELFARSSLGPAFAVAHCDFHLRGEESEGDEAFVRDWCGRHGVRLHKVDFQTADYAAELGLSMEMAARELRYGWFSGICADNGYVAVAVAHNAGDNAETLLLNLLRGTGLRGLSGMRRRGKVPGHPDTMLLRPLLGFSRAEILEYLCDIGVDHREDSTNADSSIKRNLIRNEVFPLFGKLNPSYLRTLNRDMERFAAASDALDAVLDERCAEVRLPVGTLPDGRRMLLKVSVDGLRKQAFPALVLHHLLEPYGFTQSQEEDVLSLLSASTVSGRTFEADGGELLTTSDALIVAPRPLRPPLPPASDCVVVRAPGLYEFLGRRFSVEVSPYEAGTVDLRQPAGTLIVDSDALGFPFVARRWMAGDWLRPLGMRGRKKLSDLFVDLKSPAAMRGEAVVLVDPSRPDGDASHVAALLGLRIDDGLKVTDRTKNVLTIKNL